MRHPIAVCLGVSRSQLLVPFNKQYVLYPFCAQNTQEHAKHLETVVELLRREQLQNQGLGQKCPTTEAQGSSFMATLHTVQLF